MFANNKKLPMLFEAIGDENSVCLRNWGGSQSVIHNTGILVCSHCGKEAVQVENIERLSEQMQGFKKDDCGRICVMGLIKIECPHCFEKYTSHVGMLTISRLIDRGLWPVEGLAPEYIPEYLACFPHLANK